MILAVVISISVLFVSVFKMNETIIHKNKHHEKISTRFEKITKETLRNEKGFMGLVAASLTVILSLFALLFLTKLKIEYNEALYRKESYLCFHYLNKETEDYIEKMGYFNVTLRSLSAALLISPMAPKAQVALKIADKARDLYHVYYIKKLVKNTFCKGAFSQFDFILKLPFKTRGKFLLEKNLDLTSIAGENQWDIYFSKKAEGIRRKKRFCLRSTITIKNAFFPKTKIVMREIAQKDMLNLKCFAGSQSL